MTAPAPAPAEETVDVLTRGCQAAEDRARRRATAPLMRVDARRIRSVLSRLAAVERERDEWKSLYMLAVEEGQQQINEKRAVEARAGGGPMTADVDQMRRWLAVATGREVAGNGVAERIWRAHEARHRLTTALPALLDELEQLRGKTARPSLAELQARYLEVRQHTLSTAGLTGQVLLDAEARYVLGEAWELIDAVEGLGAVDQLADMAGVDVDGRRSARAGAHAAVRHEIADVVLAATTLAGMLPGDVTVEACIDEKTEADRGRG